MLCIFELVSFLMFLVYSVESNFLGNLCVRVSSVIMVGMVVVVIIVCVVVMFVMSGVLLFSWCVMMYDEDVVGSVWNSSVMINVVLVRFNVWLMVSVNVGMVRNLMIDDMIIGCVYECMLLKFSVVFIYNSFSGIDVRLSVCIVGLIVLGICSFKVCMVMFSV